MLNTSLPDHQTLNMVVKQLLCVQFACTLFCSYINISQKKSCTGRYVHYMERSVLFWDIMQHTVLILYQRFRDNLLVPSLQGLIGLEMSVRNYHCTLRNIPEECISHPHCGRSLKLHYMKFRYQKPRGILLGKR
jgi:hypothetical protein